MTVKTQGGSVDASISASDDQVRKAIELSRPDLVQAMQNRGYHLTHITVSSETGSTGHGSPQQQQSAQARAQQPVFDSPRPGATPAAVRVSSPTTSNGVDVWI
jgi:flagellar hook-length control protein FliK